jgi:flagellar basal-body rod protein FlgG
MKEMYVALSGAVAREKQLALVANNLANVNSVGFKKDLAVFRVRPPEADLPLLEKSASPRLELPPAAQRMEGDRNYATLAESFTDFSMGTLQPTANPYDMALEARNPGLPGTPFFVVSTPQGDSLTRMGNFQVNSRQELVTPGGYPVKSQGGDVLKLTGKPGESIVISPTGEVFTGGQSVGNVRVVMVEQPAQLEKTGSGLFSDKGGQVAVRDVTPADGVSVRQHYLETSNVNVVEELVKMIDLQRAYAGFEKAIQAMDDATGKVVALSTGR